MNARNYPRGNSSDSVDTGFIWFLATSLIGLMVRMESIRRVNRITRLQETLRARAAEAGVELPERTAETLPLHSGGPQAAGTEQ